MFTSRPSLLTEIEEATLSHDSRTENTGRGEFELACAPWRRKGATSKHPNGMVVSSDDEVLQKLAESLGQCGLTPIPASSAAESGIALARNEVCIALCHDWLADGNYEDIVKLVCRSSTKVPVIVISRIGEWPEYLRAVDRGAFDYVAYPPIAGDLQRSIRNALLEYKRQRYLERS